jgi:adenine/guanine phosphoribosyltransferase-like PRPP-binding protein
MIKGERVGAEIYLQFLGCTCTRSAKKAKLQRKSSKEEYKCSSFMPKTHKHADSQEKKYRVLIVNDE